MTKPAKKNPEDTAKKNTASGRLKLSVALAGKSATQDSGVDHAERLLQERFAAAAQSRNEHPLSESPATASRAVDVNAGRFVTVALSEIVENPFNARRIYRAERIAELATSIAAHGQDVPGIATIRDGKYVLAAGHYRFKALKRNNAPTMDLMVHEGLSDQDLYSFSYRENAEREQQSALDNAMCWDALLKQGVYETDEQLAQVVGLSKATVSKTLSILKLSDGVQEIIKEDPSAFGATVLYELMLYEEASGDCEKAMEMAIKVKEGELSRQGIITAREKAGLSRTRKQKETSRPYSFNMGGACNGNMKVWGEDRITLDVKFVDPNRRDEILAALKEHFSIKD